MSHTFDIAKALKTAGLASGADDWQRELAGKLLKTCTWTCCLEYTHYCIVAVFANEALQCILFRIFRSESRRQPEMKRFASRFGLASSSEDPDPTGNNDDVDDRLPASCQFAEGSCVRKHLSMGRRFIVESGPEVPSHVAALREMFCPSIDTDTPTDTEKARVATLWRTLLPSHAQLWFRFLILHAECFPHRCLLLIVRGIDGARKNDICKQILNAPTCCIDAGFTALLRMMAWAAYPLDCQQDLRIAFLMSPMVLLIIRTWADSTVSAAFCI
jgi:hypothetical protein